MREWQIGCSPKTLMPSSIVQLRMPAAACKLSVSLHSGILQGKRT